MKITLFNDTLKNWLLHPASTMWGINGESCVGVQKAVVFEVPEDHDVFIKVWGACALVTSCVRETETRDLDDHTFHLLDSGCYEGCHLCASLKDCD